MSLNNIHNSAANLIVLQYIIIFNKLIRVYPRIANLYFGPVQMSLCTPPAARDVIDE